MFTVGDFVFYKTEGHIHLLQILQISDGYLVKDYWETETLNPEELEIRSWVKRLDVDYCEQYEFLKNEQLTEKDHVELDRFLEIEKGLNYRKQRTLSMPGLVENAVQNHDFSQALDLLTEWAMLDKYRPEIYLIREECLRKLGRDTEADYERHVYNTITGK